MERHARQVFVDTSPEECKAFLVHPAKGQRAWIISEADGRWVGRYKTLGLALDYLKSLQAMPMPRRRPEIFVMPS